MTIEAPPLDALIRRCVHCGFCTATCPTYVLNGDERDSPRGRIQMIKAMIASPAPPDAVTVKHIDRCLSCLSCVTTCPSGVDYMHLIDGARSHIETNYQRPLADRMLRNILAWLLPQPRLMRWVLHVAPLGRLVSRILPTQLRAMLDLARVGPSDGAPIPAVSRPKTPSRRAVALLTGCVQDVVARHVHAATVRLLLRHGVAVVAPPQAGCCGAIAHHLGKDSAARSDARNVINAWTGAIADHGIEAVITNASGCGTMLKDYGHLLAGDLNYADMAARISDISVDISEYLTGLDLVPVADIPPLKIAYHPACSLNHGQQVRGQPRALLTKMGFTLLPIAEEHLCCGSAGTYNILQPEIAGQLRKRKAAAIAATGAQVMVSGNVGCNTHLAGALDLPVLNTVELLDWATGGPAPEAVIRAGLCPTDWNMPTDHIPSHLQSQSRELGT